MAEPVEHSTPLKAVKLKPKTPIPPCEMCRRKKEHYFCDICKAILSTKENIEKHLLEKCNGWNTQIFHEKVVWKVKKVTNKNNNYICLTCKKMFIRQSSLINHMSVHDADRPFKCDECGKQFKKKGTLDTHYRIHTGVRPYQCDICDKQFRQQTALNNHKLLHSDVKPHICQFCFMPFRQVGNLNQHLKKIHPKEKLSLLDGFVHSPEPTKGKLKLTFVNCQSLKDEKKNCPLNG